MLGRSLQDVFVYTDGSWLYRYETYDTDKTDYPVRQLQEGTLEYREFFRRMVQDKGVNDAS